MKAWIPVAIVAAIAVVAVSGCAFAFSGIYNTGVDSQDVDSRSGTAYLRTGPGIDYSGIGTISVAGGSSTVKFGPGAAYIVYSDSEQVSRVFVDITMKSSLLSGKTVRITVGTQTSEVVFDSSGVAVAKGFVIEGSGTTLTASVSAVLTTASSVAATVGFQAEAYGSQAVGS